MTYANREQRNADFISFSLAPRYLIPMEMALSQLAPRTDYVRHNVDALLRSDLAGRYESYKLAAEVSELMGAPLLDVDKMRRLEKRPPLTAKQRADFTRRPVAPITVQTAPKE
jgi:hypothetical protein